MPLQFPGPADKPVLQLVLVVDVLATERKPHLALGDEGGKAVLDATRIPVIRVALRQLTSEVTTALRLLGMKCAAIQ